MVRLLLRRGANLDARNEDNETADALARQKGHDKMADLLADVRRAGDWKAYVCFPRKRVLALRVLCEQGRASTDDALLRRLFPASPPGPETAAALLRRPFVKAPGACEATLKRALEVALADQPGGVTIDVDALAAAQARALAAPPRKKAKVSLVARDGGRLPKEIFWLIFEYWRCDRDSRY